MHENDRIGKLAEEIRLAFGLLGRLPVGTGRPSAGETVAASAWAWPLVGGVLAALAGAAGLLATALNLPAPLAAAVALSTLMLLTGALHEDGLADTADGLWGGATPERRLEIMKDSRIGTYGMLALLLVVLLRWSALAALAGAGGGALPAAMVVAGAVSRALMAAAMAGLANARSTGLSALAGRPRSRTALHALALALALALLLSGAAGLIAFLLAALAALAVAALANARIGGQTGDILGAIQQVGETVVLVGLTAAWATG